MRLAVNDWMFDSDTREVIRKGRAVPLSPKAFALLELLIRRRPKAVSKAEIRGQLWPGTFVSPANHDQISHDVAFNGGIGVSYSLTGSIDVTATYFASLYGKNGHKINHGLSAGVTWSFSPVQVYRRLFAKSQNP